MMKNRRPGTGRRAWRCRVCAPGRWGLRAPAGRRRGVRPSKSRRPDAAGASRRRRTAAAAAPVSVSTPVSSPRRSTRTPVSHSTREPNQEKCPSFIVCLHCIFFDNSFFLCLRNYWGKSSTIFLFEFVVTLLPLLKDIDPVFNVKVSLILIKLLLCLLGSSFLIT